MNKILQIAGASIIAGAAAINQINVNTQDQLINPYVEQVDRYEMSVKGNKVNVFKDVPKIELQRFNGKDFLGVEYAKKNNTKKSKRKNLTKEVRYDYSTKESVVMTPTASETINATSFLANKANAQVATNDDSYSIDVQLNSKPTSNVFTYNLTNWEDKDFFYQPEISDADAQTFLDGCTGSSRCPTGTTLEQAKRIIRPENILGSYAVYSKSHSGHIIGQTNYETGKLYHIYRPLVSDSNGVTAWADMNISNGVMTITVPQSFLDTATYPVLVDPTFGYTSVGGSGAGPRNYAFVNSADRYTATSGDTITGLSFYTNADSVLEHYDMAIYSYTSSPQNRLASSVQGFVNPTSAGWKTLSTSQSMTGGTTYVVALGNISNIPLGYVSVTCYYDTVTSATLVQSYSVDVPLPSSWSTVDTRNDRVSAYATYTAGSATVDTPPFILFN